MDYYYIHYRSSRVDRRLNDALSGKASANSSSIVGCSSLIHNYYLLNCYCSHCSHWSGNSMEVLYRSNPNVLGVVALALSVYCAIRRSERRSNAMMYNFVSLLEVDPSPHLSADCISIRSSPDSFALRKALDYLPTNCLVAIESYYCTACSHSNDDSNHMILLICRCYNSHHRSCSCSTYCSACCTDSSNSSRYADSSNLNCSLAKAMANALWHRASIRAGPLDAIWLNVSTNDSCAFATIDFERF